jgi:hypothetical protein
LHLCMQPLQTERWLVLETVWVCLCVSERERERYREKERARLQKGRVVRGAEVQTRAADGDGGWRV